MDYIKYDAEYEQTRKDNEFYIKIFENFLVDQGSSERKKRVHLSNVRAFLNDFLLREEENRMEDGIDVIGSFFGYFYIHECRWANIWNIETAAESIERFYGCMLVNDKIDQADYDRLCTEIAFGMEGWIKESSDYVDEYVDRRLKEMKSDS